MQWERKDEKPVELRHKVVFIGAKPPYNFIHLILDPAEQGKFICGLKIWPVPLVYIMRMQLYLMYVRYKDKVVCYIYVET